MRSAACRRGRIRYHLCWGSWHGPHTTDIPLRDIVAAMLAVNAGGFSFEAGNVRHEHEWKVWREAKLREDQLILPGVVSHATNVVEHPELVADRLAHATALDPVDYSLEQISSSGIGQHALPQAPCFSQ